MSLSPGEDVKARLRPFGIVFEKSLRDLIKGIRANKEPEAQTKFLQKAVSECRQEVKSSDMDLKTMAILKLCYLEMYGFDMSWANFHVLEVMSSTKFQQKRVGYLAASQAFRNDDDVLMLTTNLLKKDINSASSIEVGVALSGVSAIVTTDLAQDITEDTIKMMNHSKPYIRKKAVLALYKIFLQYPEALRASFDRLCDKLDDPDSSVMAATVTVICELAKKTPKNFVHLAPRLYDILSSTQNNWVVIRLLKLFSSLSKIEPRLNARLVPKILEIIETTSALSLIYECINCIVVGEMLDDSNLDVAQICVDNLKPFFTNQDPNLQFVGLLTLNKIAKIQPEIVSITSDVIISCLTHADLSIREQALDLLEHIISEENLEEIVSVLINQLLPQNESSNSNTPVLSEPFKIRIITRVLDVCVMNNYTNIADFDWFISTLSDLVKIASQYSIYEIGYRLGSEFRNVLVKIPSIRSVVINEHLVELLADRLVVTNLLSALPEIIWAIGEYAMLISDTNSLLRNLINTFKTRSNIAMDDMDDAFEQDYDCAVAILIPSLVKIFNAYSNADDNYVWNYHQKQNVLAQLQVLLDFLTKTSVSKNFNVQERSIEFLEFLKLLKESLVDLEDDSLQAPLLLSAALPSLFNAWELNPIGKDVQKKLPVPADLDLDQELYPLDKTYDNYSETDGDHYLNYRNPNYNSDSDSDLLNSDEEFKEYSNPLLGIQEQHDGLYHDNSEPLESSDSAMEKRRLEKLERQKEDPFYLDYDSNIGTKSPTPEVVADNVSIHSEKKTKASSKKKKKKIAKPVVLSEEIIPDSVEDIQQDDKSPKKAKKSKKNILKIDFSGLENFDVTKNNLEAEETPVPLSVPAVKKKKPKSKKKVDAEGNVIRVKRKAKKKAVLLD